MKRVILIFLAACICLYIATSIDLQTTEADNELNAVTGASISSQEAKSDTKVRGIFKDILEKTEFVAIVTFSGDSPFVVGTWGTYVKSIQDGEVLLIPAGHYNKTEENLKKNRDIQLLIASKQLQGSYGLGQGCIIYGEGEIETEGEYARQIKENFSWARGALVVKVKKVVTLL